MLKIKIFTKIRTSGILRMGLLGVFTPAVSAATVLIFAQMEMKTLSIVKIRAVAKLK